MDLQELPKNLRNKCKLFGIDPETIDDVLSEAHEAGEEWILKMNAPLPYATVGAEFERHVTYQDALDHSLEASIGVKVLKAFDKSNKPLDFDANSARDPLALLLLLAPEEILENVPSLGDTCMIAPDSLQGFVDIISKTRYVITAASNIDKPITTESPIKFAGRYQDKIIFNAPAAYLAEKTWQRQVHKMMMIALKEGKIQEGLRPVLLPDLVKVCRLVVEIGQAKNLQYVARKGKF